MDFALDGLMDEQRCYEFLVDLLHPEGLACPRCGDREHMHVHRRHRAPVLDYRCGVCGRVFNAWTGTQLHKTSMRPSEWILLLRGFSQGTSTAQLARELGRHRQHLLQLRHRIQARAQCPPSQELLPQHVVEADEAYQNAGEKRQTTRRSERSASTPGFEVPRPRHVRARSPADRGRRRTRWRRGALDHHRA